MTLYEELKEGLLSGIEAYEQDQELRTSCVTIEDDEESKNDQVIKDVNKA